MWQSSTRYIITSPTLWGITKDLMDVVVVAQKKKSRFNVTLHILIVNLNEIRSRSIITVVTGYLGNEEGL